jgi:riboflavin kinase
LASLTFNGKVITGEGNGKKFLALPWVKQQIEQKLGFTPFLGTLNLNLTEESVTNKKILEKTRNITIQPTAGYCVGLLFHASIKGTRCAVVSPQVAGYPKNVLEVIAPVNLRDALNLKDGDEVAVYVQV